jgi:hypothetical protein
MRDESIISHQACGKPDSLAYEGINGGTKGSALTRRYATNTGLIGARAGLILLGFAGAFSVRSWSQLDVEDSFGKDGLTLTLR